MEAPGGQGLQREEKKVSCKWQISVPSSPCPPFAPSACAPCPQRPSALGSSLSLMPPPSLLGIYPVQPVPLPGGVSSAFPDLSPLPSGVSALSSLTTLETFSCSQAQCPHQHSVFKFLWLCLQLHTMLLENSPLAQAPPDAVCKWVGACSEFPSPGHPNLCRALQGQGQMGGERQRDKGQGH